MDSIFISNRLSQYFWQVNQFFKQKNRLLATLQQKIYYARTQMEAAEKQWLEAEESKSYRLQADLLMAYGHSIPKGSQSVELPDFSGSGTVEIRLKKDLSAVENAERFYRKSKGQQQDAQRLEARIESWKENLKSNTNQHIALMAVENWAGLKPFLQAVALDNEEKEILPYHAHRFLDYDIWVGKSAKANDELLRLAHKDDLWLHARDVAGSHVVIRTKKGKTTPAPVVERAAAWAAYYSKGKSEGLCPVMGTERKYVRKGKHMLPGQVRVEKEKTILVEPRE
jgi:predicted ribosome quality control (RQC) complex YloA/Tae2 family protein